MDIKQAEIKRDELESSIADFIRTYEKDTGLVVEDVLLTRIEPIGQPTRLHNVKITVELQPYTW